MEDCYAVFVRPPHGASRPWLQRGSCAACRGVGLPRAAPGLGEPRRPLGTLAAYPALEAFFDETSEQSAVKSAIVAKYFWAWAKIIMPTAKQHGGKIAYIDLFAGPGRYRDGTRSTPLLVLERSIADPHLRQMLVSIFTDADPLNTSSLHQAIDALPGIDTLRHRPQVKTHQVGADVVKSFEGTRLVPTLFFVDPWGYRGLSLRLVNSVRKDWGCDCIFFFNYNRINMGLANSAVVEHMNALFGDERADALRASLPRLSPADRELTIVEELVTALKEMGGKFVLPFCFKNASGHRTSHHLIFVTKHFKGYEVMKDIMAGESSLSDQGVPSFAFNPADARFPTLFELSRPLDALKAMLMTGFAGRRLTVRGIYGQHSVGKPYVKRNYRDVLKQLEAEGLVQADPPVAQRRTRKGEPTLPDATYITFARPGRSGS